MPLAVTNYDFSVFAHTAAAGFGSSWVSATITILVIIFLANIHFFIPAGRRLLPISEKAIADAGGRELTPRNPAPEYRRWGGAEGIVGSIVGIPLIAAIFMMAIKPGL